jgi:hypothetical protein
MMGRETAAKSRHMEPYPENLKQLAGLFKAAKTQAEREILLQGVRIISANDYEVLEEIIVRHQVREMPLPRVISLIAEQRNIPNERTEEMVRDLILDHLLDRAKLRLDARVAPAREGTQETATPHIEAPPASSVPRGAAPDKVKTPQRSVFPSSDRPQRPRPAVVILGEKEEPHQYPPPDVEQRAQHDNPAESEAGQPGEQTDASPLMPKGVG